MKLTPIARGIFAGLSVGGFIVFTLVMTALSSYTLYQISLEPDLPGDAALAGSVWQAAAMVIALLPLIVGIFFVVGLIFGGVRIMPLVYAASYGVIVLISISAAFLVCPAWLAALVALLTLPPWLLDMGYKILRNADRTLNNASRLGKGKKDGERQ